MALRAAALIAITPLLLSGCASGGASPDASAQQVVTDFLGLLESGHTAGISALLTDDSDLTPAALNSDLYSAAVARPTDAKVVSTSKEGGSGVVYAKVDYSMEGKPRTMDVAVVESNGKAKISGWLDDTLRIDLHGGPGAFEINGSYQTGASKNPVSFAPLPGIYKFSYVDPQGFGTVDPKGALTRPFEVEFPLDVARLAGAKLPSGVTAQAFGISAQPRLLSTVKRHPQAQLAALLKTCTASALVGDTCPPDLASAAGRGAAVDPTTIVWTPTTHQLSPPANEWGFFADYSVTFNRVGTAGSETEDGVFDLVVLKDAAGNPVLAAADR
jgi:hypothetical protein